MLLGGSPFVFVIDLAALASRREYLKLDKWLNDKLREHQVLGQESSVISLRARRVKVRLVRVFRRGKRIF